MRRTARRRGRIRMAGRCPEGHGPARRGSRAEREQESPCPWVTQHLQRDRTEDQGQPTWEEMLLGEPPHLSASSSLIPAGPTTWQRPAASSASPAKLLPRRQRPLGLLTPQAAWPRSIFFPLLPLPEMTRNRFPPLTALRRIPRPSASRLVSSHLAKEALAAVVCWTCLGTHTHTHTHTASLFVRPWQAMCFPNTKELCVPLIKRSVLLPCFA